MVVIKQTGTFKNTENFLDKITRINYKNILERYAKEGVEALRSATPVDTGLTASSWDYEIEYTKRGFSILWTNSNVVDGVPIAIVLQYGHGTRNGGYVQGIDYINPAIRPVFKKIQDKLWEEVRK